MGAWSSNELQLFELKIGHQDKSPINGHQGDMPYWWKPLIVQFTINAWYSLKQSQ